MSGGTVNRIVEGDGDPRHGTQNGYNNLKCRCDACREAHADYFRVGRGSESLQRYRRKNVANGKTRQGAPRKRPFNPKPALSGKRARS